MATRSIIIAAAIAASGALIAAGSSFTSAAPSDAPPATPVARQAAVPAPAPNNGSDSGKGNGDRGNSEGRDNGSNENGNRGNDDRGYGDRGGEGGDRGEGRGDEGGDRGEGRDRGGRDYDEGRIHFNDRTYSAFPSGCVTAASGLGSTSFNIFNDSRRTVEVFSGATCDNGGPVAVVGPYGATDGVFPQRVGGGVFVNDGVGASFRVIEDGFGDW
ncbi:MULTISPECIES: hypothetical protein [unclassified Streptomyces]|uniref:hypothetical protein n=1 Tax=unclassified Streptomyces TaxID=2593676 RepID=UPI0036EA92D8